jgi:hypothetical protein
MTALSTSLDNIHVVIIPIVERERWPAPTRPASDTPSTADSGTVSVSGETPRSLTAPRMAGRPVARRPARVPRTSCPSARSSRGALGGVALGRCHKPPDQAGRGHQSEDARLRYR